MTTDLSSRLGGMIASPIEITRAGHTSERSQSVRSCRASRSSIGIVLARLIGLTLGAAATVLAMLACRDPQGFGPAAMAVAMLLYAGAGAAFFRADIAGGVGAGRARP